MSLQDNLRTLREKAGYTNAKDFAQNILNIPYSSYLGYETRGVWPNEETLVKIADALHVSTDELLGHKIDELAHYMTILNNAGFEAACNEETGYISIVIDLTKVLALTLAPTIPNEEDFPLTPLPPFPETWTIGKKEFLKLVSNAEKIAKDEMEEPIISSFKKQIYLAFYASLNDTHERSADNE